jgi:predicted peptidase
VDSLVYEAIVSLNKEVGLDAKRRYVTGISRGGYGTWNFIMTRPDLFAAAIPVCGGGTARISPGVAEIAVWAFHGEKDKNVPVAGSRDMISALKKAGGHPRYTEFANEGHSIWDRASTTPGLWDWLFAQRKK